MQAQKAANSSTPSANVVPDSSLLTVATSTDSSFVLVPTHLMKIPGSSSHLNSLAASSLSNAIYQFKDRSSAANFHVISPSIVDRSFAIPRIKYEPLSVETTEISRILGRYPVKSANVISQARSRNHSTSSLISNSTVSSYRSNLQNDQPQSLPLDEQNRSHDSALLQSATAFAVCPSFIDHVSTSTRQTLHASENHPQSSTIQSLSPNSARCDSSLAVPAISIQPAVEPRSFLDSNTILPSQKLLSDFAVSSCLNSSNFSLVFVTTGIQSTQLQLVNLLHWRLWFFAFQF
jgi:hypothetical protein